MGNSNCRGVENVEYTKEVNIVENQKIEQQQQISEQNIITNTQTKRNNNDPNAQGYTGNFLIGQCNVQGYDKYQKIGFCINKHCNEKSRFICSLCNHNQLHMYNHSKDNDIIDEYQIEIRIKDNCSQLEEIYNYCHHHLQKITDKFKQYAQQLLNNINGMTKLIRLEQMNQQIDQIKQINQNNYADLQNNQDYLFNFLVNDQKKLIQNQLYNVFEKFQQINNDVKLLQSSQSEVKVIQDDLKKFYCQKYQDSLMKSCYQQKSENFLTERQQLQLPKDILNNTKVTNPKDQTMFTSSLNTPKQSDQLREELYDQFYRASEQQKPRFQFKIGQSYYKSKQYERALEQFQQTLLYENQQNFYQYLYYSGKCQLKIFEQTKFIDPQLKTDHIKNILDFFQKSLNLNDQIIKIYPKLCQIYLMLQQHKNAAEIIKRGYILDQDNAKILYYCGKIQQLQGNSNIALKYFNQSLIIKPEYELALCEIALIEYKKGNYEQIFDHLNKIIGKNPNNPEPYLLQSKAYCKTGNICKAIQFVNDGRNKFPLDNRFTDRKKKLIKDLELDNADEQLQQIDEVRILGRMITRLNRKKIQQKQKVCLKDD